LLILNIKTEYIYQIPQQTPKTVMFLLQCLVISN